MPIYITATGKKDGLGSQLLSKILGMIFAKKNNFTYVHTPFKTLDVKHQDDDGINFQKKGIFHKWVNKWEKFVNIQEKNVLGTSD